MTTHLPKPISPRAPAFRPAGPAGHRHAGALDAQEKHPGRGRDRRRGARRGQYPVHDGLPAAAGCLVPGLSRGQRGLIPGLAAIPMALATLSDAIQAARDQALREEKAEENQPR
jgi:hypothetical protein